MNVVITGTSRGIGYELVKLFLQNKQNNVLAISRTKSKLKVLESEGAKVKSFNLSDDDYTPLTEELKKMGKIDILINNAGALINKPFLSLTDQDIRYLYEVNVFSVFKLIRNTLPMFNDKAHIVNISSIGGVQGSVKFPGLSAYSSSKGALTILTECLAEEYKNTSLSFNALALGAVKTEMLKEAFPEYEPNITAQQMAKYIHDFAVDSGMLFNGKVVSVANSTP
ncbi:MAG: SDR family NAD(P)-dependent oxidoreductase [Flavobacteriales bacterium]